MVDDDRQLLEGASRVLDACADLPIASRLLVLELAWMTAAAQARNQALAFPGAFQREQARQVEQLEQIAELVTRDTPDIELVRLEQEGDWDGVLNHLAKIRDARRDQGGA
jgi:hypothetical protein